MATLPIIGRSRTTIARRSGGGTRLAVIALTLLATSCAGVAASADDPYAVRLGKLINEYRAQHDVPPLAPDASLSELAHEHAARMAQDKRRHLDSLGRGLRGGRRGARGEGGHR